MIIFSTCCNDYNILSKIINVLKNENLIIFNRDLDGIGISSNLIKTFNFNKDISSSSIKNKIIDCVIKNKYDIIGLLDGNIVPTHNSFNKMLDLLLKDELDCVFYNNLGIRYSLIRSIVFEKIKFPDFYPFNEIKNGIENNIFIELLNYYRFKYKELKYFNCYHEEVDNEDFYFLQSSAYFFIKKLIELNKFDYKCFNNNIKYTVSEDVLFYFDRICPWIKFIGQKKLKQGYNKNILIDIIISNNINMIDSYMKDLYDYIFKNIDSFITL